MVRSGESGLELLAGNTEHFIRRTVAEEDFAGSPDTEVCMHRRKAAGLQMALK